MKFRIGLVQSVWEETTVEVEASSADEAAELAIRRATAGHVEWRFLEAPNTPEIVSVDQL